MKTLFISILLMRTLFADFAFDLSQQIQSDENWLFSPFSIQSCLSMAAAGAKEETQQEMLTVLAWPDDLDFTAFQHDPLSPADFQLEIAQGVWVNDDYLLLPSYSTLLEQSFQAVAERVPFTPYTASHINEWIAEKTHQKIQNLLPDAALTRATRLVLANALYFHGNWLSPFHPSHTRLRPFHPTTETALDVPTLHQTARFPYFENSDFQAVALPFSCEVKKSRSEPVCLLFLAKENQPFTPALLHEALSQLNLEVVRLQVPKFKIEQQIDLKGPLQKLGMKNAFGEAADFSGISGQRDLLLSAVYHKSFFSFEEKGVEAAAATAGVISTTSANHPPIRIIPFIADRPFYFVLLDKQTETIFFIGKLQNPAR